MLKSYCRPFELEKTQGESEYLRPVVLTTTTPCAASFIGVEDYSSKKIFVRDNLPSSLLKGLAPAKIVGVSDKSFRELAGRSSSSIGGGPAVEWRNYGVHPTRWRDNFIGYYVGVDKLYIKNGIELVPMQPKTAGDWTCGVNSGARFAAMLGQTIVDYNRFKSDAPSYNFFTFLGVPEIGPNPARLRDHLRNQAELSGSDIGQKCSGDWPSQQRIIDRSLDLKRPILALFNLGRTLHWINIIAYIPSLRRYVILDTDGSTYQIHLQDLMKIMDCEGSAVDFFGFVEKYNTVSCTKNSSNKLYYERFFDPDYYYAMNGDLVREYSHLSFSDRSYNLYHHFIRNGIKEGRAGSATASFKAYLNRYGDLREAFGSSNYQRAAEHFRSDGEKEGRSLSH